jgi:hypothetical protein
MLLELAIGNVFRVIEILGPLGPFTVSEILRGNSIK